MCCRSSSHWEKTDETGAPAEEEQRWPELPSSVHHRDYQRTAEWAECVQSASTLILYRSLSPPSETIYSSVVIPPRPDRITPVLQSEQGSKHSTLFSRYTINVSSFARLCFKYVSKLAQLRPVSVQTTVSQHMYLLVFTMNIRNLI